MVNMAIQMRPEDSNFHCELGYQKYMAGDVNEAYQSY